jgi:hypothetical protein
MKGPESGLDRLDSTLFALMILSRIEDRRRRRRFRAVLDKIINANNRYPSDQGRHTLSVRYIKFADSLLPHFPATKRAARLRISSNSRRTRSNGCGGGYSDQFRSCWRYFSA